MSFQPSKRATSLSAEFSRRLAEGRALKVEDVLKKNPQLSESQQDLGDLIYAEKLARESSGELVRREEYQQRFPQLRNIVDAIFNSAEFSATMHSPAPEGSAAKSSASTTGGLGAGTKLGSYKILKQLGAGGMGTVYQARHEHLNRLVAIKVLAPHLVQQASLIARFRREMRAVGQLSDPRIVAATDAGEEGGVHFLVMEYIDGTDLGEFVKQHGAIGWEKGLQIVRQVALGLQHAHERGLVHRDIKPSNIFITKTGQVKILDFGLALLLDDGAANTGMTLTGQVMGTPDFMAPEQWADTHNVTSAADQYSLGCTYHHILTGKPPFQQGTKRSLPQLMSAHCNEPVPSLASILPDIPESVDELSQRLLAKSPAERFVTCGDLAEQIKILLQKKSVAEVAPKRAKVKPQAPLADDLLVIPDFNSQNELSVSEQLNQRGSGFDWLRLAPLIGAVVMTIAVLSGLWMWKNSYSTVPVKSGSQPTPTLKQNDPVAAVESDQIVPGTVQHNDRPVAGWVFTVGGAVALKTDPGRMLTSSAQLPDGNFQLDTIDLNGCAVLKDEDLRRLAGLQQLRELRLSQTAISDAGLLRIESLHELQTLHLQGCPVSDVGLKSIGKHSQLATLVLTDTNITDAGLVALGPMPELRTLMLSGRSIGNTGLTAVCSAAPQLENLYAERTIVSDLGLDSLSALKQLKALSLTLAPVTDAGLNPLMSLTSLRLLLIQGTDISAVGATRLEQALPACRIFGGRFDPRRQTAARVLAAGGSLTLLTANRPRKYTSFMEFPEGEFEVQELDLSNVKTVRRSELPNYLFHELTSLNLSASSVDPYDLHSLSTSCPFLTALDLSKTDFALVDISQLTPLKNLLRLTLDKPQYDLMLEPLKKVLGTDCEIRHLE